MKPLNHRQEAFAQAVVNNGGDKVAARAAAGYSMEMSKASQGVDADKLYNHPRISLRIAELQESAAIIAKEKFSISVEQRLKWLKEVAEAGLGTYHDQVGNKRRENLAATRAAVQTMNEMLGVSPDDGSFSRKSFNVTLRVEDASSDE